MSLRKVKMSDADADLLRVMIKTTSAGRRRGKEILYVTRPRRSVQTSDDRNPPVTFRFSSQECYGRTAYYALGKPL
jgi:hypothetical protein